MYSSSAALCSKDGLTIVAATTLPTCEVPTTYPRASVSLKSALCFSSTPMR